MKGEHPPLNGKEEGSANSIPVPNQRQQDKILGAFFSRDPGNVFSNKDFTLSSEEREGLFKRILDPKERQRMLKVMAEYIDEKFTGENVEAKKAQYQQQLIFLADEGLRRQKEIEGVPEASEPSEQEVQPDEIRQQKLLTALLAPSEEEIEKVFSQEDVPPLSPENRAKALEFLNTAEGQEKAAGICITRGRGGPKYAAQLELLKKEAQAAPTSTPEQTPEPEPVPSAPAGEATARAIRDALVANKVVPPTAFEVARGAARPLNGKSARKAERAVAKAREEELLGPAKRIYHDILSAAKRSGISEAEFKETKIGKRAHQAMEKVKKAADEFPRESDSGRREKIHNRITQWTKALINISRVQEGPEPKAELGTPEVIPEPVAQAPAPANERDAKRNRFEDKNQEILAELQTLYDGNVPPDILGFLTSYGREYTESLEKGNDAGMDLTLQRMEDFLAHERLEAAERKKQETAAPPPAPVGEETQGAHDFFDEKLGVPESGDMTAQEKREGTRSELVQRLREAVGKVVKVMGESAGKVSEGYTKLREFSDKRAKTIDAQSETSGAEKMVQRMGELYNKLNGREKFGIGLVFGASAVVTGGASIYLPYFFAGLLGVQRAFGMASLYLNQQKELQNAKVMESGQLISFKERAAISAVSSGALMGAAIGKTIEWANESGLVERTREWLGGMLGHSAPAVSTTAEIPAGQESFANDDYGTAKSYETMQAATPEYSAAATIEPAAAPPPSMGFSTDDVLAQQQHAAAASEAPAAPPAAVAEIPAGQESFANDDYGTAKSYETMQAAITPETGPVQPIEAVRGKGAEWMMKRLVEQLQEKGVTADRYPEGSAMRELLDADKKSINDVVHRIASEQGLFKKDGGESILIKLGDKLSFNADGSLSFTDAGGEELTASTRAAFTPAYTPEAPALKAPLGPNDIPQEAAPAELTKETIAIREPIKTVDLTEAQRVAAEQAAAITPTPEDSVLRTSDGGVVRTSEGAPVQVGTPEQLSGTNELVSRLETIQSPTEIRSTLEEIFKTGGISKDTVEAAVKAAPRMSVDPSLVKLIEPDTGQIPGPMVFLGKDGGLTVFGAAPAGDTYEVQRSVAKDFATRAGQAVRVLLSGGEEGYELVRPNGRISVERPHWYSSYKAPLSVSQSVYAFPR